MIDGAISNPVQTPSNSNNTVAKPKKFFKSRNSVPDANAIVVALSDSQVIGSPSNVASYYSSPTASVHHQHHYQQTPVHPYPEKTKRKKSTKSGDSPKKSKAEKSLKVEKPPKPDKAPKPEKLPKPPKSEKSQKSQKKKAKVIEKPVDTPKPTRVLSRTRKVVNYSEDQSHSPPRNAHTKVTTDELSTQSYVHNDLVTSSSVQPPAEVANNLYEQSAQQSFQPAYHDEQYQSGDGSPSKNSLGCGPPIKLRISKVSIFLHFRTCSICDDLLI